MKYRKKGSVRETLSPIVVHQFYGKKGERQNSIKKSQNEKKKYGGKQYCMIYAINVGGSSWIYISLKDYTEK